MKINTKKTEVMTSGREQITPGIRISGTPLKQVNTLTYLGSKITSTGKSSTDIKSRIVQTKVAFNNKTALLASRNISIDIRKTFIKRYVWSVALYGPEAWTLGKADVRRLEAFEMWCWRRTGRIPCTERLTNEDVLKSKDEKRTLIKKIRKRRDQMIGHIYRYNSFMVTVMEAMIEGRRGRDRPRLQYITQIQDNIGARSCKEMKRLTEDREEWRARISPDQSSD